ncbi:hypothetical protein ABID43_004784 [Methylobacterium goesingense]|uniref:DUF551 domain-containing protein n=1 Tax=Methylobacterium goesingense TaxID=243690 RepID=A0ABV2LBI8_9HYPH
MRTWRAMDRAPHDGRWIIAIHRDDPDRRAVIRWDPEAAGDPRPWHVASCQHSYPADAFTDWMDFPDCPPPDRPPPDRPQPESPAPQAARDFSPTGDHDGDQDHGPAHPPG